MARILIALVVFLSACAPRGQLVLLEGPAPVTREVFVGTTRGEDEMSGEVFGTARNEALRLARFEIAVPPTHEPGKISYPIAHRKPDPSRDFMLAGAETYASAAGFEADLRGALARNRQEAIVFVHGYNMNFAEGLYRVGQLGEDFALPGVMVHYSWPSKAHVMAYAYDRDSALFARDGFEALLQSLQRAGARKVTIVAHSMGSALTMETLRQIRISGQSGLMGQISGVVLISPDIDIDLFRAQALRVQPLPQPFILFTSKKDLALRLSTLISREEARLGSMQDVSKLADLKLTVIDTAAFSTGDGHFNVGESPELIRLLQATGQVAEVLETEQAGHANLASAVVITVQNTTQIILRPLGG
ncbi:MAG: alpha/beta fold hydrolase [Paracoccaceae bacterium]